MAEAALALRVVHVLAATVLVGGAALLALAPPAAGSAGARRYEQGAWLALGILVATGVGNAGALGAALPGPATSWGAAFLGKLALVGAALVLTAFRSVLVAFLDAPAEAPVGATMRARRLRAAYAASALLYAAVVALGVGLAHG